MATIRNKKISRTGSVRLSFVAVLVIAAATLFTSGKPVEELSGNAAASRSSPPPEPPCRCLSTTKHSRSTGNRTTSPSPMPASARRKASKA